MKATQKRRKDSNWINFNCLSFRLLCGPGGDRTLVQTGKPYAFYMLISLLDCRAECGAGTALHNAVSSENFICGMRLPPTISDMLHHTGQEASGKTALGWCLVPAPGAGIKPIYCASIKQRERKNFRQINCYRPWLRWPPAGSPHAYIPSRPAVKSSQALMIRTAKIRLFRGSPKLFCRKHY